MYEKKGARKLVNKVGKKRSVELGKWACMESIIEVGKKVWKNSSKEPDK